MIKLHGRDKRHPERPACGVLPGYYQPIRFASDAKEITCARCKRAVYKLNLHDALIPTYEK